MACFGDCSLIALIRYLSQQDFRCFKALPGVGPAPPPPQNIEGPLRSGVRQGWEQNGANLTKKRAFCGKKGLISAVYAFETKKLDE